MCQTCRGETLCKKKCITSVWVICKQVKNSWEKKKLVVGCMWERKYAWRTKYGKRCIYEEFCEGRGAKRVSNIVGKQSKLYRIN